MYEDDTHTSGLNILQSKKSSNKSHIRMKASPYKRLHLKESINQASFDKVLDINAKKRHIMMNAQSTEDEEEKDLYQDKSTFLVKSSVILRAVNKVLEDDPIKHSSRIPVKSILLTSKSMTLSEMSMDYSNIKLSLRPNASDECMRNTKIPQVIDNLISFEAVKPSLLDASSSMTHKAAFSNQALSLKKNVNQENTSNPLESCEIVLKRIKNQKISDLFLFSGSDSELDNESSE